MPKIGRHAKNKDVASPPPASWLQPKREQAPALQSHRKFSTSIRSLPDSSDWVYKKVRRSGETVRPQVGLAFNRDNDAIRAGCEVFEPDVRNAFFVRFRDVIDPIFQDDPAARRMDKIDEAGFSAAAGRNSPNAISVWPALIVVEELAVGRLNRSAFADLSDRNGVTSSNRHFPNLLLTASVGLKVDPLSIGRPVWVRIDGRVLRQLTSTRLPRRR